MSVAVAEKTYVPTHPEIARVNFVHEGETRSSSLRTVKAFRKGQILAHLTGTEDMAKSWRTVQYGQDKHIELNSDLVFINHSCDPNVAFVLTSPNKQDWHLAALKDIPSGTDLTFFYPSTEWRMDEPFNCFCRQSNCLGRIRGAEALTLEELEARQFMSDFIRASVQDRDASSAREKSQNAGQTRQSVGVPS